MTECINEGLFRKKKKSEEKRPLQFENSDKFITPIALDFKKHLESKLKSSDIGVGLSDDNEAIYFEYDMYEDTPENEAKYYNEKSKQIAKAIMSYNKNVLCDKNEKDFIIDKRIEYNNAIIDLSYKEDRMNCFILPVVEKNMIPSNYTYLQVKTLLKDINIFSIAFYDDKIVIDLHTSNVDSYMKKVSNIFKNANITKKERKFGMSETIEIKFEEEIKESYTLERGEVKMKSINTLASIARMNDLEPTRNRLRDDIVSEYTEVLESLNILDAKSVMEISLLPTYRILEGYAVDLESLKYVMEDKQCTIEEAINSIKEVNYISEKSQMYCVLPKNINENMNIESFVKLNTTLNEAGIVPIMNTVLKAEDFLIKVNNTLSKS